mgnify:CR=1 FL=1
MKPSQPSATCRGRPPQATRSIRPAALYLQGGLEVERVVDEFSDRPYEGGRVFTIIGSRR